VDKDNVRYGPDGKVISFEVTGEDAQRLMDLIARLAPHILVRFSEPDPTPPPDDQAGTEPDAG
jgi:hypothetical protein